MKDTEFVQIVTTTDHKNHAELIARTLVEMRLAACVQIVGPVTSVYRWQGAIETAEEWQCLIKSCRERYDDVAQVIKDIHPYDVPEIIMLPITGGHAPYLHWLRETVESEEP